MRNLNDFSIDSKHISAYCYIEAFTDEKKESVNQLFSLFASEAEKENDLKLWAIITPFEAVTARGKTANGYRLRVNPVDDSRRVVAMSTWRRACELLAGRLGVALKSPIHPLVTFPDGSVVSVIPR